MREYRINPTIVDSRHLVFSVDSSEYMDEFGAFADISEYFKSNRSGLVRIYFPTFGKRDQIENLYEDSGEQLFNFFDMLGTITDHLKEYGISSKQIAFAVNEIYVGAPAYLRQEAEKRGFSIVNSNICDPVDTINSKNFADLVKYLRDTYGVAADLVEGWYECPECGEPMYFEDLIDHDYVRCECCGFNFYTQELEDDLI